jgi:hypothetical protein
MPCLNRLFSHKELEALDERQLKILDDAIMAEIRTSKDITDILRRKFKAGLYDRWLAEQRTQRGPGTRAIRKKEK